ncbi:sodium:proline symporter [Salinisphaera orenii MK-B5]|uniref:Sodium:proline symporter n=1 Tax=Salinisphaera orenii MK-B5 TaxID=856730 RepID=A0A423PMH3_9GAMM|nr:sodium:solute symporter family protein [Salinisphaera orenii]ROO26825.1 sodium:proline symporter [Salinisphaera orenii MK-B5]
MAMFSAFDQTVLGILIGAYFLLLVAISFVINRGVTTYEDYSVAGRSVGFFPITLTLVGTAIGGSILLGFMSKGYELGMGQVWLLIVMLVTSIFMALFMIRPIRDMGSQRRLVTVGDFTSAIYGPKARFPTALSMLVAYCSITGMQFVAVATILNLTIGLDMTRGILLGAVLLTIKTYLGGLKSVVFQDAIHGTVQTIGIFVLFFVVLSVAGGWSQVSENARAAGNAAQLNWLHIPPSQVAVALLTIGAYQMVRQDLWQRIWAARSMRTIQTGFWTAVILQTVVGFAIVAIGVMARYGLELETDDPSLIYYQTVGAVFPFPLVVVMVLALLATVISCADSFFLAGSASIVNDIIRPRLDNPDSHRMLLYSKLSVALTAVIATLLALYIPELVTLWIVGTAMLVSGILAPVLFGLFWPRVTPTAGVASMWVGLLVAILWQLLGQPFGLHPVFIGLPLSIVTIVAMSLRATPRRESAPASE